MISPVLVSTESRTETSNALRVERLPEIGQVPVKGSSPFLHLILPHADDGHWVLPETVAARAGLGGGTLDRDSKLMLAWHWLPNGNSRWMRNFVGEYLILS
jgi:hypothetical protein